jgi:dihydrofolate synthase/folylpolyglutamate synthase
MEKDTKLIINELFGRQRAGIKPGLERTLTLLEKLGSPHKNIKSIHIAGTNGKGTISSLFASYYQELNLKVGLYTSPHIIDFNERIRINGNQIPNEYIIEKYKFLLDEINNIDATFFEITTCIAFSYFAENNCDICIIETGMGGRFDSTNVVTPIMSVITSISYDHKEYLGDTIEEICSEKAGIVKENIPVYIGNVNPDLHYIIEKEAAKKKATVLKLTEQKEIIKKIEERNFIAKYESERNVFECNLLGLHNYINLNVVANILSKLRRYDDDVFIRAVKNLNRNTGYFGRMSIIKTNPYLILDTSHNQEALEYLVKLISNNTKNKFNVIFTSMKDKESAINLSILKGITNKLILTKSSNPRNEELNVLKNIAILQKYNEIVCYENISECLKNELNSTEDILIVGSFFLISDVIKNLKLSI